MAAPANESEEHEMDERRILTEEEAFRLLTHLFATAELHTTEGGYYSDKRIVEGCLPLVDPMIQNGGPDSSDWLEAFKSDTQEALANWTRDQDAYRDFLQRAVGRIVKRRQERSVPTGFLAHLE